MSTPIHTSSASPEALIEPTDCRTAHFETSWPEAGTDGRHSAR